jgi:hypothetical protein
MWRREYKRRLFDWQMLGKTSLTSLFAALLCVQFMCVGEVFLCLVSQFEWKERRKAVNQFIVIEINSYTFSWVDQLAVTDNGYMGLFAETKLCGKVYCTFITDAHLTTFNNKKKEIYLYEEIIALNKSFHANGSR